MKLNTGRLGKFAEAFSIMENNELIPHLFRTEYRKIVSVLCKTFGFHEIEIAEDIASDTFATAARTWGLNGIPENPTAWLYTVAKNKAKKGAIEFSSFMFLGCVKMPARFAPPPRPKITSCGLPRQLLAGFGTSRERYR